MDRLAFNAVASINEQRIARQMTTNELANVSTPGFKRSFEAAMRPIMIEGAGFETRFQPQAQSTDNINLKPGSQMATGNDLDISLGVMAVMGVSAPDGTLAFTRRGDLRLTATGALENGAGHLVRGQGGGAITVPPGFRVNINDDGSVYATNPAQAGPAAPVLIDRILLRDASQTPLDRRADGLFKVLGKPPGTDIAAIAGVPLPSLTSKTLEGSNVNPLEVMVKMMEQSRSFEQQVNIIKQSKDADEAGASMMKPA
jgi:flagellar basal-body rod protein FlgF